MSLFAQLRSFCFTIENDVAKLRKGVEKSGKNGSGKSSSASSTSEQDEAFVRSLLDEVLVLRTKLEEMEENLLGPIDSRLAQVNVSEILDRCNALHESNAQLLACISARVLGKGKATITTGVDEEESMQDENTNCNNANSSRFLDDDNGEEKVEEEEELFLSKRLMEEDEEQELQEGEEENAVLATKDAGNDEEGEEKAQARQVVDKLSQDLSLMMCSPPMRTSATALEDLDDDANEKTPVLAEWKLSEATRALVGAGAYSRAGAACTPSSSPRAGPFSASKQSVAAIFSLAASAAPTPRAEQAAESSPYAMSKSIRVGTPDTPVTPELGVVSSSAAALLTNQKSSSKKNSSVNSSVKKRRSSKSGNSSCSSSTTTSVSKTPVGYKFSASSSNNLHSSTAFSLDDSPASPASLGFSPPRMAKLLQPRKVGSSSSNGEAWIPLVSELEWDQAPKFIKMQASLEMINEALGVLNNSISSTQRQSFSQIQIDTLVGAKPLVLGLVQLKRLDCGFEDGNKVYKVKRFYA